MKLQRFFALKIRKRRRHRASNDLFVILENKPGRHQIDDISSRGLSYHYVDSGHTPKSGTFALKVIAKDNSISLNLVGRIIGDRETGALASGNQIIKRHCIHFEKMNSSQKKAIKRILKDYTVKSFVF